jgi:hypothetical protein
VSDEDEGEPKTSQSSSGSSDSSGSTEEGGHSGSERGTGLEGVSGSDATEDTMTAAPGSISILESCLVDWASKSRMRLKVTVRITHDSANGEVEVEVSYEWGFVLLKGGYLL